MDINQDLAQPLEHEVTKAPPESEVYTLSPKDAKTLKTLPSQPEIDFELDIKETKTLERTYGDSGGIGTGNLLFT